jgi:hypothetical protein
VIFPVAQVKYNENHGFDGKVFYASHHWTNWPWPIDQSVPALFPVVYDSRVRF